MFCCELVYKFKRIVGEPSFGGQFRRIVKRCVGVGCGFDVVRQSACLVFGLVAVVAVVSSLVARRWVRPQTL